MPKHKGGGTKKYNNQLDIFWNTAIYLNIIDKLKKNKHIIRYFGSAIVASTSTLFVYKLNQYPVTNSHSMFGHRHVSLLQNKKCNSHFLLLLHRSPLPPFPLLASLSSCVVSLVLILMPSLSLVWLSLLSRREGGFQC